MFSTLFRRPTPADLGDTRLFDQDSFYKAFLKDLGKCQHEVIIESPFITRRRLETLLPTIQKLKSRKVRVIINTRSPLDRKLAIIDRQILWEGSLNILSQNDSCEVMRRITSTQHAWQMTRFIGIDKLIN